MKLIVTDFAFVEECYAVKINPLLSLIALEIFNILNRGNYKRCSQSALCLVFVELSWV